MPQCLKISLVLALPLLLAAVLPADELSLAPRQGVLLLRNGELVAGEILLSGDRYDVRVAGGQIHIKRSEVEYFGSSVLDCYQRKRVQVEPGKVQQSLELADWCLRQHLYEQAALALADAVDSDPQHPRIPLLERRLKFALEQPVTPAGHTAPADDAVSIEDLNRLVEGLPAGCVETFTSAIQPMLMNHCSTAGCHGPQSAGSLKLLRTSGSRIPSRRATQRNLYAVLQLVDRERPSESRLLTLPTRPHGNVKSAIFTSRETNQYRLLVAWVYQLSGLPQPSEAATSVELPGPAPRRASRRTAASKPPRSSNPMTAGKQAGANGAAAPTAESPAPGQIEVRRNPAGRQRRAGRRRSVRSRRFQWPLSSAGWG